MRVAKIMAGVRGWRVAVAALVLMSFASAAQAAPCRPGHGGYGPIIGAVRPAE